MTDQVSVLDVDPGLAELVPNEQRPQARQATGATILRYGTGSWREPEHDTTERARGGYGLLIVEGLLLRRVGVGGRYAAELLGPGDLLRPWQTEDESGLDGTGPGGSPRRPGSRSSTRAGRAVPRAGRSSAPSSPAARCPAPCGW